MALAAVSVNSHNGRLPAARPVICVTVYGRGRVAGDVPRRLARTLYHHHHPHHNLISNTIMEKRKQIALRPRTLTCNQQQQKKGDLVMRLQRPTAKADRPPLGSQT